MNATYHLSHIKFNAAIFSFEYQIRTLRNQTINDHVY